MRHTLSECDARQAALAWREQLLGRVRLEVELNDCEHDPTRVAPRGFAIVESFAWVTFVFDGFQREGFRAVGDVAKVAAAARDATIVWYALTCCPGYGGSENPNFWRRVFTELTHDDDSAGFSANRRKQEPITEAVRFFDDPDKPFPRVRLVPRDRDAEQCVRSFVLADSPATSRLESVLASLKPFIRSARWSRAVPVAIDELPAEILAQFLPSLQLRCTPSAPGPLAVPHFPIEAVFLQGSDLTSIDALQRITVHSYATMVVRRCDVSDLYGIISAPEQVNTQLTRRLRVHAVNLIRPIESARHFAALCAVLPSSEWISTCRVFSFGALSPKDTSYRANVAWLAYALFHPGHADKSASFSGLELSLHRLPLDLLVILRSMETGNNLLQFLLGKRKAPTSQGYYLGRIHADTVARANRNRFSHSVHTFESETWATICTTTTDIASMPPWVAVVIPGVGLGWIRKESIRSAVKRTPEARVRSLRVSLAVDPNQAVMPLLRRCGSSVEYLDIVEVALASYIDAETLLRLCPRLKSLRTAYSASVINNDELTWSHDDKPKLHELELQFRHIFRDGVALNALRSPIFSQLNALRVVMRTGNGFPLSREGVIETLKTTPSIQYFHWDGRSVSRRRGAASPNDNYDDRHHASLKQLGDDISWQILNGPAKFDHRLAFLSVVHHENARSSGETPSLVAAMGPDLLGTIFSFLPTNAPRELCIVDESSDIATRLRQLMPPI